MSSKPAAVAERPAIEAITPEVLSRIEAIALAPELPPEARDMAAATIESTSHDAVFAEMNDSPTVAGAVRLDVGQSRRAMAMLVMALLATELAPRPDRLDEDGTYLHPLPSRHPIPNRFQPDAQLMKDYARNTAGLTGGLGPLFLVNQARLNQELDRQQNSYKTSQRNSAPPPKAMVLPPKVRR